MRCRSSPLPDSPIFAVSQAEFQKLARRGGSYIPRFFGSWRTAVERAGLIYRSRHPHPTLSDEEIKSDLRRVQALLSHPPSWIEYRASGRHSTVTVSAHAGAARWHEVLMRFLDLDEEEAKHWASPRRGPNRYRTTTERLEDLRAMARRLGRTPMAREAGGMGVVLTQRLGSWTKVLKAAGLPPPLNRKSRVMAMAADAVAEQIAGVARRLGHLPSMREMDREGLISSATAARRFGSWSKALTAAQQKYSNLQQRK